MQCRHCLHRNLPAPTAPDLSPAELRALVEQAADLGASWLSLYPRSGDICLGDGNESLDLLALARGRGLSVKTVTSGASAKGVERLLPYLSKLTVSVDSLDAVQYAAFRPAGAHRGLMDTLALLADHRRHRPDLGLTALVMVGRSTLETVERRVESIASLGLFDKIKLLELLPLGHGAALRGETLASRDDLARLATLRCAYAGGPVRIGTPLWRVKEGRPGCRLGSKDLVVGPQGQVAGCTLLLYLGETVADARAVPLTEAWMRGFAPERGHTAPPPSSVCGACPFFAEGLCRGGCRARVRLFGGAVERARSCGVTGTDSGRRLYARYRRHLATGAPGPFTAPSGDGEARPDCPTCTRCHPAPLAAAG